MAGPIKKGSPNGKTRLLNFLRNLLADPSFADIIMWTDKDNQEFRMLKPHQVAEQWGKETNNFTMNYDKMSRGLRYFYQDGTLKKINGKDSRYQFLDKDPSSPSSSSSSNSSSPTATAFPIPSYMLLPSFTGFPLPGTPLPNFGGIQMGLTSGAASGAPGPPGAPGASSSSYSIDNLLSDSSTTSSPTSSRASASAPASGSTPSPTSGATTSSGGAPPPIMDPLNPIFMAQILFNIMMNQNLQNLQNPPNNQ